MSFKYVISLQSFVMIIKSTVQLHQLLIVDDEPDVTELLKYKLEQDGYRCKVLNNPVQFVGCVRDYHPDLIILDIMMPGLDGIQLCNIAKADPVMKDIPIIFLTARDEPEDRIKGLKAGSDDYISKPFNMQELLLRVDKVLMRSKQSSGSDPTPKRIQIAGVILDEEMHQVTVDEEEVVLTATEFRLLKLLMERKGRVKSREKLLANVWNYDSDIETRTVDTHVRRLREKLGVYDKMIKTIRGVGYRVVDI